MSVYTQDDLIDMDSMKRKAIISDNLTVRQTPYSTEIS
jgi:hypothetical protein